MRRPLELLGGLAVVVGLLFMFLPWPAALAFSVLLTFAFAPAWRQLRIAWQLQRLQRQAPTPSTPPPDHAAPPASSASTAMPKDTPAWMEQEREQPRADYPLLPPMVQ
jgi:hypothetical protein